MITLPYIIALLLTQSVWTSTGIDILRSDTPPEVENVRVESDGSIRLSVGLEIRAEFEDNAVWSIAAAPDGRWYAGTGSAGRVYAGGRTPTDPTAILLEEGDLLAATYLPGTGPLFGLTPGGTIYRLAPDGRPEPVLETGEDYIFALLPGPDGVVYCATGSAGRLYRFRPGGEAELLFSATQANITSLAWLEPGRTLLAGTSPEGLVYRLDFESGSTQARASVLHDTPWNEISALAVTGQAEDRRIYIAANADDEGGPDQGAVLSVRENGARDWQWLSPDGAIHDLAPDGDGILVATGYGGLIYRLDRQGRPAIFQQVPAERVLCLTPTADGLLAGTSEPATVVHLTGGPAGSGRVQSTVQDCEGPAVFGRITYRAQVPAGTGIQLETRTGNSEIPDPTWTEWQPVNDIVRSLPGRFIQWQARLSAHLPGRTPVLERVDIHYAIPNRPPAVSGLELAPVSSAEAVRGQARPVRELSWSSNDPDNDSLSFVLSYQPEGHDRWLSLTADLAEPAYELDTRMLADGWYRFRVQASDAPVRPHAEALTAEMISLPTLIDNTPPRITGLNVSGNRLRFTVSDELSPVSSARVAVNAGPWQAMTPQDGLFDHTEEKFDLEIELRPGTNHIAVRAADAQGNSSTAGLSVNR